MIAGARFAPAPLEAGEIRRLVSIGFHAVLNGKPQLAKRLFDGLAALRPQEGFPRIGKALALLAEGRPHEAARVLEDALARRPQDEDLQVFLGMALHIGQRAHHARTVLAALAQSDGASPAARLAQRLFEQRPAIEERARRAPAALVMSEPNRSEQYEHY
jgi:predicted Zn-dependent protease